ncbi:MAG: agmatinase [Parcubacteria group bacterium CG1_02_42_13]|nr:MAG: agmatinase [Parcubacteria group bacterium CG1_02_42_13]PIR58523.1 MAG: agmatinase [Parcubacteria group bacterium CG10_big_fil_rev_8_21_14_0_10_35_15]
MYLPYNFGGLNNQSYKKAKVVVLPISLEKTVSYMPGTKFGPRAIINASRYIELFDIEMGRDLSQIGIFTLPELLFAKKSLEESIKEIKQAALNLLKDKKFILSLGGEHTISYGLISAFKEKYKDFSVLQIDAHSDLRDEYEGTKFSHACVMRRVRDLGISVTGVGIRSQDETEIGYMKKKKIKTIFYAPMIPLKKIISSLSKNVYITFDVDGLDPSIMPSTGTPEPGGLGWYEVLSLIKQVAKERKIVGADIVELSPLKGIIFPDFLAAKLAYKIIGYSL